MNIALLEHDTITIKSGDDRIKLFRIISTRGITIKKPVFDKNANLLIWEDEFIEKHSIGGYVESINQLEGNSWLDSHAKVWGNAKIIDSVIMDTAKVCDDAVISNSYITNLAMICNNAKINESWVGDQVLVKQNAEIQNSKLFNSCMVFGNAKVFKSYIYDGCYVMKDAIVEGCTMKDTSMIGGNAHVRNCMLSNRASFTEGVHESKNIDFDVELKSVIPDRFYEVDF
jgi:carbonic anhydrase/acetyltransferase-like protein (isoleucine patch superfamily)